jgi:hypothetical protein
VVNELELVSTSPFIGAEIAIKTMLKGFRVGEVGIQTFPRQFGRSSSTSLRNILATLRGRRVAFLARHNALAIVPVALVLGGISASGASVDASLLSQNITTSGNVSSSQVGFSQGTAANATSRDLNSSMSA